MIILAGAVQMRLIFLGFFLSFLEVFCLYSPTMATQPLTNWSTGLFSCCDNCSSCEVSSKLLKLLFTFGAEGSLSSASFSGCYGFWCCPCLACTVSGMAGANHCLPLCDIFSPAILTSCGVPLSIPPALLSVRVATRQKYGIEVKDLRG